MSIFQDKEYLTLGNVYTIISMLGFNNIKSVYQRNSHAILGEDARIKVRFDDGSVINIVITMKDLLGKSTEMCIVDGLLRNLPPTDRKIRMLNYGKV
jgi:hypothetical protein